MKYKLLSSLFFLLQLTICIGQTESKKDSAAIYQLNEVVVKGIIAKKRKQVSENVEVLSKETIYNNDGFQYQTVLNQIPGVFMQNGVLNTNRITIRGIGARSPFATTSIRTYFGDIPLTDGNGISAIEDLEFATLQAIEVHKGPAASSFGVGLGGAIILQPNFGEYNNLETSIQTTHGSFGLLRNVASVQYGNNKMKSNYVYSNTHSDGYRENNEYDRQTFTALVHWDISDKDKLQVTGNFTDLKAYIPSSLNYDDYITSPEKAAFTWGASQGNEDFQSYLAGITWQHLFKKDLELKTSTFGSFKKNYESRPFNILDEDSKIFGARTQLSKKGKQFSWGVGGEYFYDNNSNKTLENLYSASNPGSVAGEILTNFNEFRSYYNLFLELEFKVNKQFLINSGFNLNKTQYNIKNQTVNNSESFGFNPVFSPKLGFVYLANSVLKFRGNVAHGFANPTSEETLLPDGIFNPDLNAEKGWNLEFGIDYTSKNNKLIIKLKIK